MRRFLLHVLPHGFHRIRHYGLLANASRVENLARARTMLMAVIPALLVASLVAASDAVHDTEADDAHHCPCCGAPMIVIETVERGHAPRAPPPPAGDLP